MASRPIEEVLNRLEGVRPTNGSWKALCPNHADTEPSLSIKEGDDGRVLLTCFGGCSFGAVVKALGLEQRDLFADRNGGGGGSRRSGKRKYANTSEAGCTLIRYAEAKKLPASFLESLGVGEIPNYNGHPAVRFPYLSAEAEEVCTRFRVSLAGNPRIKTRRGDKLTLYGLWKLREARERGYLIIVEGESDAQTLWFHGFPAVGVPGASTWRSEWSGHLDGIEKVYVIVEPDQGGLALWERLSASPIRERLYRVSLGEFKDASELHLEDPARASERITQALGGAVSFMDIAESEALERSRGAWESCEELANEERILDRFAART